MGYEIHPHEASRPETRCHLLGRSLDKHPSGKVRRGGRGGGLWAGQEQGPGLLNKQLLTHGSPEPGLGLRFPIPFGPRGYPPSSAAGDTAVAEGSATAPLCGVRLAPCPAGDPGQVFVLTACLG